MIKNLELIAAVGENYELGKDNKLIWRIKKDLQTFKTITMWKNMVMGKNTYDSMPKHLEGRKYIVLTRQNIELENATVYHSKSEFIKNLKFNERYIICGGAQIYKLFIDDVETMFLTHIEESHEADAFFPQFDKSQFNSELLVNTEENGIKYKQYKYTRIK